MSEGRVSAPERGDEDIGGKKLVERIVLRVALVPQDEGDRFSRVVEEPATQL